jgi:hypothetical protein
MDPSTAVPFAGSCATCGAPLQAGRAACPECGAPVAVQGADLPPGGAGAGWAKVTPEARSDLRPPGPNQWYSDRFRSAASGEADGAPAPRGPTAPTVAGLFSDLPFRAPPVAVGWLVVVGTWVSAVAFVLPWASANGLGYLESWGLYKPSHVLVFFLVVIVALLALLPLRVPAVIRLGVVPLLLGAFEVGLFWEWVGSQSLGLGIWTLIVGALLCIVGGVAVASRLLEPLRPT